MPQGRSVSRCRDDDGWHDRNEPDRDHAITSPAKAETGSAPAAPETTTAPGTSASAQHTQTYRLVANPAALTPHVGKKLELTGTLVDQAASTTATASGPALKVESGKVLAASCQE
jgi:hypothetical protein